MLHASVADHDADFSNHRHQLDGERLEIDFDRMKRFAEQRRNLVEQSAFDPNEIVLCSLANFRDFKLVAHGQRRQFTVGNCDRSRFGERVRPNPADR